MMSKNVSEGYPIKTFGSIEVNTSIPSSSSNYYSYPNREIKYIVMHYTGNSSDTAKSNASYFGGGERGASAHYFVDDTSCYQSVALNNAAWGVGGTSVYKHTDCRNLNSVSIEMCTGGDYIVSDTTIENAAYLCATLCDYLDIGAEEVDTYVLRHYDVWDKRCPAQWASENSAEWSAFKEKIKSVLKGSEELTMSQYEELNARLKKLETPMIYNYIDENMPEWAREAVQWCVDKGIIAGTGSGLGLDDSKLWTCVVIYRLAKQI